MTGLLCKAKGIILIYTSCGSDQYFGQVDVCICYFGKQIVVSFNDCLAQEFNINDENMIHTVALLGAESQPRRRQLKKANNSQADTLGLERRNWT